MSLYNISNTIYRNVINLQACVNAMKMRQFLDQKIFILISRTFVTKELLNNKSDPVSAISLGTSKKITG